MRKKRQIFREVHLHNIYEGNSASFEDKMEFRRQLLPKSSVPLLERLTAPLKRHE